MIEHAGWVTPRLASELRKMAGFRNILVHGYLAVNPVIVRDVVENRLQDIEAFVALIRQRFDDVSSE